MWYFWHFDCYRLYYKINTYKNTLHTNIRNQTNICRWGVQTSWRLCNLDPLLSYPGWLSGLDCLVFLWPLPTNCPVRWPGGRAGNEPAISPIRRVRGRSIRQRLCLVGAWLPRPGDVRVVDVTLELAGCKLRKAKKEKIKMVFNESMTRCVEINKLADSDKSSLYWRNIPVNGLGFSFY